MPTPPQAGRQPSATLQAVIPLAIPPAPAAAQAPCPPLLRRYGNGASAAAPRAPLHAACSRQAPRRRTSVTDACWSHAAFRYAYPLTTRLSQFVLRYAARTVPSAPFAPSGVSLRSTSSSPALFPCCASPFLLRLRGLRQPYDELHCVPSIVRLPPSATAHHSLRITTPQQRPPVARYANSAVRSRRPSGGTRSVRTSLHAIRRQSSVLEPAQLARCASPARKLAPMRSSCFRTP